MNEGIMLLHQETGFKLFGTEIPAGMPRGEAETIAKKKLITSIFGIDASLSHNQSGAPFIANLPDLKISISHSRSYCLLAISDNVNPIGVDIENHRPQLLRITEKFLTKKESSQLSGLPSDELLTKLTGLWTAKEAVYKAALTPGLGLREIEIDTENFSATARGITFRLCCPAAPPDSCITVALMLSSRV